ncbi:AMP-binding protein [Aquabacter sp. CN5-332]|uniref:AMP-binding protein n=1 Tax=Aquabacter sp. CN5-332 TaxID=3156608 RepID=UPI0032B5431F
MADDLYPPYRSLADVEALEDIPLEARITQWDFAEVLRAACLRAPEKPALHYVENGDAEAPAVSISYGMLLRQATQVANLLRANGVGPDDAVALVLPTLPATFAALLGALFGAKAFPLNWMLQPAALGQLIAASGARAIIALGPTPGFGIWEAVCGYPALQGIPLFSVGGPGGEMLPETDLLLRARVHRDDGLEFERRPAKPDDIAAYVHSGGTTGTPKIVQLTNRGLVYRVWATNMVLAHTSDEVMLADTPLFHIGGFTVRGLVPIADGMTLVIPSVLGARDKAYMANYWRFVERFRITRLSGVPTTLAVLTRNPPQGEDISSLRATFGTGSTAVPPAVQRRIEDLAGVRALIMYGITENCSLVSIDPRDGPAKAGCSGIRLPYTDIRVVELDGNGAIRRACAVNEVGAILVRSPGVSPGYLDPALDAGTFLDGWLVTGDLGRIDEDGYVCVTGRAKDIIIRGGHNIDPRQIEEALIEHPAVAHAAAVAKPDLHAGELPIAYVQLHDGASATPEELAAFASTHISERVALPKEIILLDRIPLSDVGKPLKAVLREDAAMRAFSAALADLTVPITVDVAMGKEAMRATITVCAPARAHETLLRAIDARLAGFTATFDVAWKLPVETGAQA